MVDAVVETRPSDVDVASDKLMEKYVVVDAVDAFEVECIVVAGAVVAVATSTQLVAVGEQQY